MSHIVVEVLLYGECARYGNQINAEGVASLKAKLLVGSTIQALLDYLLICTHEFDTLLINGQPSAMSDKQVDLNHRLQDGDRVDLLDTQNAQSSPYSQMHRG